MTKTKHCKRCGGEPHAAPLLECPMKPDMWKALFRWQLNHGYMWKSKLLRAWATGKDVGETLLRVKNAITPMALYRIDLGAMEE